MRYPIWLPILLGFLTAVRVTGTDRAAFFSASSCHKPPPFFDAAANARAETSARDSWTWWLPGHSHVCVYETPQGRTILRPVPSFK